jgi:hypothetical protein
MLAAAIIVAAGRLHMLAAAKSGLAYIATLAAGRARRRG